MALRSKFSLCACSVKVDLDPLNILLLLAITVLHFVSRKSAGATLKEGKVLPPGSSVLPCQAPEAWKVFLESTSCSTGGFPSPTQGSEGQSVVKEDLLSGHNSNSIFVYSPCLE